MCKNALGAKVYLQSTEYSRTIYAQSMSHRTPKDKRGGCGEGERTEIDQVLVLQPNFISIFAGRPSIVNTELSSTDKFLFQTKMALNRRMRRYKLKLLADALASMVAGAGSFSSLTVE